MNLSVGCANCLCSLSPWERVGVRVLWPELKTPLTLTLSQGERGKKVPVKMNVTMHQEQALLYSWQVAYSGPLLP